MERNNFLILLLIGVIHIIINNAIALKIPNNSVLYINAFLISLTTVINVVKKKYKKQFKQKALNNLIVNFLRMFFSVLFLLPIILSNDALKLNYILHFFAIYFLYQLIELRNYVKKKK
tara:strand:- start:7437 stop:7790 length:354 start_codon:yes stop_codon:yes gene_type:complete